MSTTFFSIITSSYNGEKTVQRLIRSLAEQTCKDFEWVVQDGVSKDGTLTIIDAHKDALPAVFVQSEPDTGIYNAWNKAVARAQGKWLIFLGVDDWLAAPDVLEKVKAQLESEPEHIRFAVGKMIMCKEDGTVLWRYCPNLPKIQRQLPCHMALAPPATFYRYDLFGPAPFDANFKIAGDYDFVRRVWNSNTAIALDFLVTYMQQGGISSREEMQSLTNHEVRIIRWRYAGWRAPYYECYYFLICYFLSPAYVWDIFAKKCKQYPVLLPLWNALKRGKDSIKCCIKRLAASKK